MAEARDADARDDEALMAAWRAGDVGAFEALFARHRRPLFTFLLHLTGARDLAEDIFQETFVRVLRARERYEASGRFVAWLHVIARNALRDHQRRAGVRRVVTTESTLTGDGGDATPARLEDLQGTRTDRRGDPAVQSESQDLRARIEAALLELPPAQREVFLLRERAGLDYAAIAEVVDCPPATAKSRMRYALSGLRRLLAGELAGSPGSAP